MKLHDFLNLIDPDFEGRAWLNFINEDGKIEAKANTNSSFLSPIYDKEIDFVSAAGEDKFDVYLAGEI